MLGSRDLGMCPSASFIERLLTSYLSGTFHKPESEVPVRVLSSQLANLTCSTAYRSVANEKEAAIPR